MEILWLEEVKREGLRPQGVGEEEPGPLVGAGLRQKQCLWVGSELREREGQSPLEVIGQVGATVGWAPLRGERM